MSNPTPSRSTPNFFPIHPRGAAFEPLMAGRAHDASVRLRGDVRAAVGLDRIITAELLRITPLSRPAAP